MLCGPAGNDAREFRRGNMDNTRARETFENQSKINGETQEIPGNPLKIKEAHGNSWETYGNPSEIKATHGTSLEIN